MLLNKASDSSIRTDFNDPRAIRALIGNWYIGLAWLDLISSAISLLTCYWTDQLHITFTFLFLFWLGRSIKEASPTARRWAIGIGTVISAFSISGFFLEDFRATFGSFNYYKGDVGLTIVIIAFIAAFAIPAIFLLTDRGRQAFPAKKKQNKSEQATPRKPFD